MPLFITCAGSARATGSSIAPSFAWAKTFDDKTLLSWIQGERGATIRCQLRLCPRGHSPSPPLSPRMTPDKTPSRLASEPQAYNQAPANISGKSQFPRYRAYFRFSQSGMVVCVGRIPFDVHDHASAVDHNGPFRCLFPSIQFHPYSVKSPGVSGKTRDATALSATTSTGLLRCCHRHHLQHLTPLA